MVINCGILLSCTYYLRVVPILFLSIIVVVVVVVVNPRRDGLGNRKNRKSTEMKFSTDGFCVIDIS